MSDCPICGAYLKSGICRSKGCKFSYAEKNHEKGVIEIYLMNNRKLTYPISGDTDPHDFILNNKDKIIDDIASIIDEDAVEPEPEPPHGSSGTPVCPFTSIRCLRTKCAIWDDETLQCSIKTIAGTITEKNK